MNKEDRIFVKDGRKHYRPRYSLTEFRIGMAILFGLVLIAAWVVHKSKHPDPELYKDAPGLVNRAPKTVDRGPVPNGLAPEGWREGSLSSFGKDDLYEKINGREGYYKSFGFERLFFVSISSGTTAVDIEMYDLGAPNNALGAFAGEVPEGMRPEVVDGGISVVARNAAMVARGKYYVRAIGADESPKTKAALAHVLSVLQSSLEGKELPGSYGAFSKLGVPFSKISFMTENAFSFGFAKDVHVGLLEDGETEVFVVFGASEGLDRQFIQGFQQYGEKVEGGWVKDRYLSRVSFATMVDDVLIGVRGAADVASGTAALESLESAVRPAVDEEH